MVLLDCQVFIRKGHAPLLALPGVPRPRRILRTVDPRVRGPKHGVEYTPESAELVAEWLFYALHLRQVFAQTAFSAPTRAKSDAKGRFQGVVSVGFRSQEDFGP